MTCMPVLKIPSLNIVRDLRGKLLKMKPIESYSANYVEFVVRITLSSIFGNATLISAMWDVKQNCWEGNMNYLEKNHRWVMIE